MIITLAAPLPALAVEHVTLARDGASIHLSGKVQVEAQDGGLLFLADDNVIWNVQPAEIVTRKADATRFRYLSSDAMARRLLAEMPDGFRIHKTNHYVICYNTTPAYAQWCGALYERLYRGFFQFWKNKGLELEEPDWPLVALVFDDQATYARHTRAELGAATGSIIGYYSMRTNRVNMYDLTGIDGQRQPQRLRTAAHINAILSQPAAERTVATIVHEATHQLAFNSGLQQRYADIPYWVSEGIALYFEIPDLKSSKGWGSIGAVNQFNLLHFRQSLSDRGEDSLTSLLRGNDRFRDPQQARAAYAESWALTYHLMRRHEQPFLNYLKTLSQLQPLKNVSADERVDQFKEYFGADLEAFDAELLRAMRGLPAR